MDGPQHGALAGDQRFAPEDGDLVDKRQAIARGLAHGVGQLFLRQMGDGQRGDDALAQAVGQAAEHGFLEVGHQGGGVGLAHFHQTADDGLARLQEKFKELRRHLVVVALVGGDEDDDVGEGGGLDEAGDVALGRPGGHVGTVPDDEVAEQVDDVGVRRHAANLIHVLVDARRAGLRQARQRAEKAEVVRPGDRPGGAGVGDGMAA